MDFYIQLFRGLTSSMHPIPAPLMLKRKGSFVSLNWGPCWSWGLRKAVWGVGELRAEPGVGLGFSLLLCDLRFSPFPLWTFTSPSLA